MKVKSGLGLLKEYCDEFYGPPDCQMSTKEELVGDLPAIIDGIEAEMMALPKDADGIPLRVGDWVESAEMVPTQVVGVGPTCVFLDDGDWSLSSARLDSWDVRVSKDLSDPVAKEIFSAVLGSAAQRGCVPTAEAEVRCRFRFRDLVEKGMAPEGIAARWLDLCERYDLGKVRAMPTLWAWLDPDPNAPRETYLTSLGVSKAVRSGSVLQGDSGKEENDA